MGWFRKATSILTAANDETLLLQTKIQTMIMNLRTLGLMVEGIKKNVKEIVAELDAARKGGV